MFYNIHDTYKFNNNGIDNDDDDDNNDVYDNNGSKLIIMLWRLMYVISIVCDGRLI